MAKRKGKVDAVTYFLFLGSQITVDNDCSHEIKRRLLLGRKALTNLDSILKSRDVTLLTKILASSPITSWQIDGETMEIVIDFSLGSSIITADGDCSHEIKRCLLRGRKVMTNLDSILKSRDIANKGPSSQGYGFSRSHVWM